MKIIDTEDKTIIITEGDPYFDDYAVVFVPNANEK